MLKRELLKLMLGSSAFAISGLLKPVKVWAIWNDAAFGAQNLKAALDAYYPGANIKASDRISIGVRQEIENGAVVPIKVTSDLPDIKSIAIFVEKNPNPLIANFDLSPRTSGFVSTRIKMDQSSEIMVVVVSGGQVYSNKTYVTVHEGGCA